MQVFDLGKYKPDQVLTRLWQNFDEATGSQEEAQHLKANLRIITAGGDGTVAWVLQVRVHKPQLDTAVAAAVVGQKAAMLHMHCASTHTDAACVCLTCRCMHADHRTPGAAAAACGGCDSSRNWERPLAQLWMGTCIHQGVDPGSCSAA
jgi:Diacylglycerol kinase catalytic domain